MKNDIVEAQSFPVSTQDFNRSLSINAEDISRVSDHLNMVKEIVSKILREGGKEADGDYGIVPGTKKKSLFKPGAEKLMRLFGLGVRFKMVDKEFDRYENFASFTYDAEVYHLKTGTILANCEGTANSQEKKYKEKGVYTNNVLSGKEAISVCDILNTLKKMAQKRAMVGAVIIATAASDYFTQDEDEIDAQKAEKKEAQKSDASRFNKGAGLSPASFIIPMGKFKDKKISEVDPKELNGYVNYLTDNNPNIDGAMKVFIDQARDYLKTI